MEAALEKASAALVCDKWYNENKAKLNKAALIVVPDTIKALGLLAAYHRKRFNCELIAIGGANGKTTTKDITAHLISRQFKTLKTSGNFNNQLGVPFVLFQIDETIEKAVLEIGTNEPGEIEILANITAPNIGLVTNIGREHLEKLIDLDGVEKEECSLFDYLTKFGGKALINCDDKKLKKYNAKLKNKISFSSAKDSDIIVKIDFNEYLNPILKVKILEDKFTAQMQTIGLASAYNAIAAIAVAFSAGVSIQNIKEGLESYKLDAPHGYARMALEKIKDFYILNDCYKRKSRFNEDCA